MAKRKQHPAIGFVRACRNDDGGYGQFPGDVSSPAATAQAALTLKMLGAPLRGEPAARTVRFLRSLQSEAGGFVDPRGRWHDTPWMRPTWWAWRGLKSLGAAPARKGALKRWILDRQLETGGVCGDFMPPRYGQVITTYFAVEMLGDLGVKADGSELRGALAFLRFMEHLSLREDGSFSPVNKNIYRLYPSNLSYTWATSAGVRALDLLGKRPLREADCRGYLLGTQHADGGFGFGHGDEWVYTDPMHSRLFDTVSALEALAVLGPLPAAKSTRCAKWIGRLANPDGGFARSAERWCRPSELAETWRAVRCCALLGVDVPRAKRSVEPVRVDAAPLPVPTPGHIDVWVPHAEPAQFAALRRVVEPLGGKFATQFELVKHLSGYVYRHMHFHEQYTNESAVLLELQQGQCGCRARLLLGLCWAAGIVGRWLWCPGHSLTELFVDGRWVLFDSTVEKVYRKRGRLLTAFDVHEMFRGGKPEVIDFGNKTLSEYRAICPKRGGGYRMQWVRLRDRKGGKVEQMLYKPPRRIIFPWTLRLSQ